MFKGFPIWSRRIQPRVKWWHRDAWESGCLLILRSVIWGWRSWSLVGMPRRPGPIPLSLLALPRILAIDRRRTVRSALRSKWGWKFIDRDAEVAILECPDLLYLLRCGLFFVGFLIILIITAILADVCYWFEWIFPAIGTPPLHMVACYPIIPKWQLLSVSQHINLRTIHAVELYIDLVIPILPS